MAMPRGHPEIYLITLKATNIMKEIVSIIIVLSFYLLISYIVQAALLKSNKMQFIIVCLVYAAVTNYLFDLLFYLHAVLISRNIYFNYGHGNILLFEIFGVCIVIGSINILIVLIKLWKKNKFTK
jgi:hypothetical protein